MEPMNDFLVGVRLRETAPADDYRVAEDLELHVGDLVLVETSAESTIGEVRRPRPGFPKRKKDRPTGAAPPLPTTRGRGRTPGAGAPRGGPARQPRTGAW